MIRWPPKELKQHFTLTKACWWKADVWGAWHEVSSSNTCEFKAQEIAHDSHGELVCGGAVSLRVPGCGEGRVRARRGYRGRGSFGDHQPNFDHPAAVPLLPRPDPAHSGREVHDAQYLVRRRLSGREELFPAICDR